ncbi:ribonuclease HII [Gracilibacillus oryzae]|uniref:Ribonuclease HII n=1 Tax=Gracilibacillus oryzae TaxID=1672701 RepID=A0A7C8GV77_9BACI|nr:ribonuclease HII [Gracilibacillus oryzae]KAB8138720.1 ribonuclease HII [Gracilibacillus oryzae]
MDSTWTIKQIQSYIESSEWTDEIKIVLQNDKRKGVQKLIQYYDKQAKLKQELNQQFITMSRFERENWESGKQFIAGVDEVGRGPLAGPVVAAAVVLPADFYLLGIDDSKKLTKQTRERYYHYITENALAYQTGIIEPVEIDQLNIYQATKKAMKMALEKLPLNIDHALIDAMELENLPFTTDSIIKGDQKSISIAAASIIAKVTRDRMMVQYHEQYPHFHFEKNSGYGTKDHLEAINRFGITDIHRKSFLKNII